jgi:multiple antibiotic resistance protein
MAVMINLATEVKFWAEWLIFIAAAGAVCIISFFVLAESVWFARFLGVNGMNALSKLMGFLLLALAIQFMLNGIDTTLLQLLAKYKHAA